MKGIKRKLRRERARRDGRNDWNLMIGVPLVALVAQAIFTLTGCGKQPEIDFVRKQGTYEGYNTIAINDAGGRRITIYEGEKTIDLDDPSVKAKDNYPADGRFDSLELDSLPKGHPLEKYANFEDLEVIYEHTKQTGDKWDL